jgi:hypothetical protein
VSNKRQNEFVLVAKKEGIRRPKNSIPFNIKNMYNEPFYIEIIKATSARF